MIPERLVPETLEWELYNHEHKQRYEFFANRCEGLMVLDAACGVGYGSQILAKAGASFVIGTDISKEAIAYADHHFDCPNLSFLSSDVEQLAMPDQMFDLVISFETIEHVRNPEVFLSEVHRVLKPGGLFICSTPNKDFSGRDEQHINPYHLSEMAFEEFAAVFTQHFCIEEQYHQSHSDAYRRHVELLQELGQIVKPVRFSTLLRSENFARRLLRREQWSPLALSSRLGRAVAGDYIIEPLEKPADTHLTLILVGRAT